MPGPSQPPCVAARPITPGTIVRAGRGVVIACSAAGNVRLVMADGSFLDVYAGVGTAEFFGYAVVGVDGPGTTATAKVTVVE
ncbi:hypothetical protein [Methylobacterium aquaticum]|uniref:Uncharacterized protein n=1 Tax=Methylobacterium aquaticum TaxID=270351 RepID=A0A0C6EVA3_9HYPH|nr:hypothetical protein [Methylobacterium aquaticum]BAQ43976.1 hypothetical protein Maq22A_c02495 [Methylobacterium aquaticum]